MDANKLKLRLADLRSQRVQHEQVWRDCFEVSYPQRGTGLMSEVMDAGDAQQSQSLRAQAALAREIPCRRAQRRRLRTRSASNSTLLRRCRS